jgi:hypothetical protein
VVDRPFKFDSEFARHLDSNGCTLTNTLQVDFSTFLGQTPLAWPHIIQFQQYDIGPNALIGL